MSKELEVAWIEFVRKLFDLKKAWKEFQDLRISQSSIRKMNPKFQRILARVSHRAKFEVAMEALMSYWRVSGGIDVLMPPPSDENEIKEEKINARRKK
uniref:Uncharacterized protein n=1 Tax=viral metagenome TaxID=1070528 RepID=A0A6M3LJM8_9ZZZZ